MEFGHSFIIRLSHTEDVRSKKLLKSIRRYRLEENYLTLIFLSFEYFFIQKNKKLAKPSIIF